MVQQGQSLCEMDASAYAELVSNQEIAVEQARTNRLQAALDLDVAQSLFRPIAREKRSRSRQPIWVKSRWRRRI